MSKHQQKKNIVEYQRQAQANERTSSLDRSLTSLNTAPPASVTAPISFNFSQPPRFASAFGLLLADVEPIRFFCPVMVCLRYHRHHVSIVYVFLRIRCCPLSLFLPN
jgi:hypothetical protein